MDTQRDPATGNGPDGAGTAPGPERPRLTVAVLTYLRNAYLAELLPALVEQAGSVAGRARVRILVVDNDPAGGAERTVSAVRPAGADSDGAGPAPGAEPEVVYVHEPEPGIVAGRNRALDESGRERLLVFIDDDELPRPGWLAALLDARERHGCAAVTGPTPPVFETAPDPWVAACGAFDSWEAADGARVRSADTGNLLLDLGRVRALDLRFDPRYGLTGGEDSLFTRSLTLAGEEIRRAAAAEGKSCTWRFSPGYGDLPLVCQRDFLGLLDAPRQIGLTLTPQLMMVPEKSVSAIIGVGAPSREGPRRGCEGCALQKNCVYRREGLHCAEKLG